MKDKILVASKQLIEQLEFNGVKYCHWKSNEHLFEGLIGKTDLDILVDREDKWKFERVLNELKYIRVYGRNNNTSGVDNWLGYHEDDICYIHLHVHYDLVTGKKWVKEYHLPWRNVVLSNTLISEFGMPIIEPNLEMVLFVVRIALKSKFKTLIKCFLANHSVASSSTEKEIRYLERFLVKDKIRHYTKELRISKETTDNIFRIIENHSYSALSIFRLKRKLVKELKEYTSINSLAASSKYFSNKLYDMTFALSERFVSGKLSSGFRRKESSGGGSLIAIIGADGSGKSTNIKSICEWLKWKFEVKLVYAGSGDGSNNLIQKTINRVFSGSHSTSYEATSKGNTKRDSKGKQSGLKKIVKACILSYSATSKYRSIRRAYRLRNKGYIVLVDRYPQNQIVGINDSPRIGVLLKNESNNGIVNHFRRIEENAFNKMALISPDVVIKLCVSPEVAQSRKPDHNLEYIKSKSEIVNKLWFPEAKTYDINADVDLAEVQKTMKRIIWENIQ